MTKVDLIAALAQATDLTKVKAEECLASLTEILQNELQNNGKALLPHLGKLHVVQRAARTGRNPRTGEAVRIQSRKAVKFCPGKRLKEIVQ